LKPENIFIQDGLFKIGDFGLSYKSSSKDRKLRGGTLAYLAPEAFSETNKASDIYSLGIIFYKLMHIEHPYYSSEEWK
jgi:serine/threonine protein kinase